MSLTKKKTDESAQNVSKFSLEKSQSYRFFNYLHDSNSIFRVAGINTETFCGRTGRHCPIEQGNLLEIDQGNLMSVTAPKHRLGLYLMSKDRLLLRNIAKKSVITNSKQLKPKKSADSYKDNYGNRNWNFVKLINKVLQRCKNYGNFRVLPSILMREENSSRIRTLFWDSQAEYRNCEMK